MNMYHALAAHYDSLVKDDEATKAWVDLIERSASFHHVVECACGSGEITLALARKGYTIEASDLSEDMINQARQKKDAEKVKWSVQNMVDLHIEQTPDLMLCLCDSLNYLLEDEQIIKVMHQSYELLAKDGTFIFDVHSLDRIDEFKEEFLEEGCLDGTNYEWSIQSDEDLIYQNFVFYDECANAHYEQHIQRVYDPMWLKSEAEKCGFSVEIFTDFVHVGITEGEKYFYILKKGVKS